MGTDPVDRRPALLAARPLCPPAASSEGCRPSRRLDRPRPARRLRRLCLCGRPLPQATLTGHRGPLACLGLLRDTVDPPHLLQSRAGRARLWRPAPHSPPVGPRPTFPGSTVPTEGEMVMGESGGSRNSNDVGPTGQVSSEPMRGTEWVSEFMLR